MSVGDYFVYPEALPLAALSPAAWLLLWVLDRARGRRLFRAVGPRGRALQSEGVRGARPLRRALFCAGLLLALLAVAQPVWGTGGAQVEPRGVDILVCLDVSQSMLAQDVAPSRLQRAKREIRALAENAAGERIGLVVFAGSARLVVPLTRDLKSLVEIADLQGPLSVPRGGTDLGGALSAALDALVVRQEGDERVIVLLTDGEDHEDHALRIARECAKGGLTVHCIGFGSSRGAKVPVGSGFLRDRGGQEVVTVMDPATLKGIAAATGGTFLDAQTDPRPLVDLYEGRIVPMARALTKTRERREGENRFQWPLLAALLLWTAELSVRERGRR